MTTPILPDPREPLTTLRELAVWVQEPDGIETDRIPFATLILEATAVLVRDAGSWSWTHDNIPPRAKLIADLKAKDFFEHPLGEKNETVGPLSSGYVDRVLTGLELTEGEIQLLARLAGDDDDGDGEADLVGIWTLSTTRGPLETHHCPSGVLTVPWRTDRPGSKPLPYYAVGRFGSPLMDQFLEQDPVYPAELL